MRRSLSITSLALLIACSSAQAISTIQPSDDLRPPRPRDEMPQNDRPHHKGDRPERGARGEGRTEGRADRGDDNRRESDRPRYGPHDRPSDRPHARPDAERNDPQGGPRGEMRGGPHGRGHNFDGPRGIDGPRDLDGPRQGRRGEGFNGRGEQDRGRGPVKGPGFDGPRGFNRDQQGPPPHGPRGMRRGPDGDQGRGFGPPPRGPQFRKGDGPRDFNARDRGPKDDQTNRDDRNGPRGEGSRERRAPRHLDQPNDHQPGAKPNDAPSTEAKPAQFKARSSWPFD